MQSQLFFYINMALCAAVFLELLFSFRKNTFLKICFLLIIASLFAMNYFSCAGVTTRLQVLVVKLMRLIYVCSTMLSIIYLVNPRIPRWVTWFIVLAASVVTGIRIIYFNQIDIEHLSNLSNHIFSTGIELYTPKAVARYIVLSLATAAILIAFYYYRRLMVKLDWESPNYKQLLLWIVSFVTPFFLLIIFSILGNLGIFEQYFSAYLFSLFNCLILISILLRPRFLNTRSY